MSASLLDDLDDFAIDHWLTSKNFLYDLQKEATRYETCERVKIPMKTGTCWKFDISHFDEMIGHG